MPKSETEIPGWAQALSQRMEGWRFCIDRLRTKKDKNVAVFYATLDATNTAMEHSEEIADMFAKLGDDMRDAIRFALGAPTDE